VALIGGRTVANNHDAPASSWSNKAGSIGIFAVGLIGVAFFAIVADSVGKNHGHIQSENLGIIKDVIIKPKTSNCSKPGESCYHSKCCAIPGTQCYAKKGTWATCKVTCTTGPDPTDTNADPWSCKPLGKRAPGLAPPPNFQTKAADWVEKKCAGVGENCEKSKCCKEGGKQCFQKTKGWASCKADCVADGPDPVDTNSDPWECKALGSRTPGVASGWATPAKWVAENCSKVGENCEKSKCCKGAGMQCYAKEDGWATCMSKCLPGPQLTDSEHSPWSCQPLGGRTPGMAQQEGHVRPRKWVEEKCSKPGENCNSTMCCADATMQCYEKNAGWASCRRGCNPGHVQEDDKEKSPWSCNALGPRTPRPWANPALYCFHVMMVNSYEAGIVRSEAQKNGGVGIFSCEQYDVFASDGEAYLGDGPLGPIQTHHFQPAAVTRSVDGTAGNTALFRNVWAAVNWIGRWKLTDWTIKVDPDAVLIPDRMRQHLKWHTGTPCYIVNCNKPFMLQPMMFGSVESISRQGLEKYFANTGACNWGYEFGEDKWLMKCLSALGVQAPQDFGAVGDNVCTGANCADGKAAYHPFKNVGAWAGCWAQASR